MRMLLWLFLLFPLLELALLIKVGASIGVLPTLSLVLLSAVLGSMVLRLAGLSTALRARERLMRGEAPERDMLDGLLLAVAGGLLLFPGLISDVFGLLLLLSPLRALLIGALCRRVEEQALRQRAFADDPAARAQPGRSNVIEGEYERRDK